MIKKFSHFCFSERGRVPFSGEIYIALGLVACCATRYNWDMIQSFRHKGLGKFFASGSAAGIQPHHAKRLRMLLAALDTAQSIEDMDIAGFRLHPLKGFEPRRWSVWVNGNWRLTFEFKDGHAFVLQYEDYH
jgi:proteic killer suppression protein